MPKFRKKAEPVVEARQLTEDHVVDGLIRGVEGDWLISKGNGESFCMTNEDFEEAYERVWWSDTQQRYVAYS